MSETPPLPRLALFNETLAFAAQLTLVGLKPMSRHEGKLPAEVTAALQTMGLVVAANDRQTTTGKAVEETLFSRSQTVLNLYLKALAHAPLAIGPDLGRLEGWLFGFPPCCVETYLKHPYAPNQLPVGDQEILFHWACSGCTVTPHLITTYREVLAEVRLAGHLSGVG